MLECTKKYYRVDRREISFLRFIIEAYDGIAFLSTVDARAGHVVLHVPPGNQEVVDRIVDELKQTILIKPIESTDEN